MKYRINYGNGQVSRCYSSKREALRELAKLDCARAFVQFRDPDTLEWFRTGSRRANGEQL